MSNNSNVKKYQTKKMSRLIVMMEIMLKSVIIAVRICWTSMLPLIVQEVEGMLANFLFKAIKRHKLA